MRDLIKDKLYFENYITRVNNSIEKFESLKENAGNSVLEDKGKMNTLYKALEKYYSDKINALYSSGSDIKLIKREYSKYLSCFVKRWEKGDGYESLLKIISLAVLLGITDDLLNNIINFIENKDVSDLIIDYMLKSLYSDWKMIDNTVCYPKRYLDLERILKCDKKRNSYRC